MKYFNSATEQKSFISFQLLLVMCFSSLKKSPEFCSRLGAKIVKSLRLPNGDNSTCPVHPAEYRRRFSPQGVFFNADKQAQDHHARDLADSPKLFSIRNDFRNPMISPRLRPRDWCR
jgi:hypothetical protein